MSKDLNKIDEKFQETEVYHQIMSSVDAFGRISGNIPRNMCEITQHIYGRFDNAAEKVSKAANTHKTDKKIEYLEEASADLFFQYNSLETLVKAKGITVGAANEVIKNIKPAYNGTKKWLNSTIKNKASE